MAEGRKCSLQLTETPRVVVYLACFIVCDFAYKEYTTTRGVSVSCNEHFLPSAINSYYILEFKKETIYLFLLQKLSVSFKGKFYL